MPHRDVAPTTRVAFNLRDNTFRSNGKYDRDGRFGRSNRSAGPGALPHGGPNRGTKPRPVQYLNMVPARFEEQEVRL